MKTPFFLIDKIKLDNNISSFKSALTKIWPNSKIAYSVKTNSLPWLLNHIRTRDLMAEVVSDEEYELSLMCGFKKNEIVFNGPIKGRDNFLDSIKNGSIVNIDSKSEIEIVRKDIKQYKGNIGIRVNIDTSIFDNNDIGYIDEGFRFGFPDENGELGKTIDLIRFHDKHNRVGLHFHCNSITRSLDVYHKLAKYAKYLIKKHEILPSFVDIGGGFFGGVEGKPTATEYIITIHDALKDVVDVKNTMLIIEPGSAIIGSAVEFHTSVKDIKDTSKSRIVTTDGSRINIDPLWSKDRYAYRIRKEVPSNSNIPTQIICGYTCMDHDRIMTLVKENELSIGDKIIYEKVGSYSVTFGGPFIRYFPEVYIRDEKGIELVRKRMETRDYYEIQTR